MSKVERLLDEWDMDGVGDQMEAYWLGTGQEQYSLRKLAEWFNEQLLERALDESNESYVEGEVENMYRLLTSDEVSRGVQAEVETRLEQAGIDVDNLETSFVSHQSIYTYLTKVRGVSRSDETTDESQIEKTNSSIQRLVNRTNAVVNKNLQSLRNTDRISLGEFSVFVDINVYCHECDTQYSVQELLTQRGCDCARSGE
ncbi:rod-determining factor RdfA [Haloarcula marina]|uniref:rod-determining factor RdfA n=1 Tax=Haloarcula marina TaxID=2961574 RepID=UPI0020B76D45|nr:rod-determining factor RdfA [Halomicroarcula marina]